MAETTEDLYSLDPDVLIPLVRGSQINGYPVIDVGTNGAYTFVLCFRPHEAAAERGQPFVTWSIWRTETGKIAAGLGHYIESLPKALADLHHRVGDRSKLRDVAALFTEEADRL